MHLVSALRVIKFSFQDIIRNIWLSIVIVIILSLALFSINLLLTVKIIGESAIAAVKQKIDVNVYLKNTATEDQAMALKAEIANFPVVENVSYVSKNDALAVFKEKHKDNPEILSSLEELNKNPLAPTLVVKPKDVDSLDDLINRINGLNNDIIESKNFTDYKAMLEKINKITDKVEEAGILLSAIFIFITLLVVYNSVRVAIYTHQKEIIIMRLVGAANWFVQTPYVVSSVIYSIVGVAIVMAVFFPFLALLQPYLETFFVGYNVNILNYFKDNVVMIFGLQILGVSLVNIVSSLSAVRIYSKV